MTKRRGRPSPWEKHRQKVLDWMETNNRGSDACATALMPPEANTPTLRKQFRAYCRALRKRYQKPGHPKPPEPTEPFTDAEPPPENEDLAGYYRRLIAEQETAIRKARGLGHTNSANTAVKIQMEAREKLAALELKEPDPDPLEEMTADELCEWCVEMVLDSETPRKLVEAIHDAAQKRLGPRLRIVE